VFRSGHEAVQRTSSNGHTGASQQGIRFAGSSHHGGAAMDTFFVRKQLIVGAVLLGCLEVGVVLFNVFAH